MWYELLYAIPLGLSLSFAAGPVFFVVIETSISKGRTQALFLDLGVIVADLIFIALAFFGSQTFIETLESNFYLAIISGLAIIIFGGYYIRKSKKSGQLTQDLQIRRKRFFFIKGFLLNFLNVGVLFYWITTTVAIGSLMDHNPERMLIFYAATLSAYLVIDLFKIYYANKFKKQLAGRRMQMVESILGILLIAFGIFIVVRNIWL